MEKGFLYAFGKAMRSIIGLTVVILSFGFLFMLMVQKIPVENKDIITLSAGSILACLAGVTGYYFGASKDSSDQNKATIATQTDNNIKPQ